MIKNSILDFCFTILASFQGDLYRNCDDPYEKLSEIFGYILNHHAPLKEKRITGNHAPFMTKELRVKQLWKNRKAEISIWSGHLEKITYLTNDKTKV